MPQDKILSAYGSTLGSLSEGEIRKGLFEAFDQLGTRHRVLALPSGGSRFCAQTGLMLKAVHDYYGEKLCAIMPTSGTQKALDKTDLIEQYPGISPSLFRIHDRHHEVSELGRVPAEYVYEVSSGLYSSELPVEVNRLVVEGGFDLILTIGPVVPQEVTGMANYSDTLFLGVGGKVCLERSCWLGASYGIERVLGRIDNPVRKVFDFAQEQFAAPLPITAVMSVVDSFGPGEATLRGLFIGTGRESFEAAASLSRELNVNHLDQPIQKAVSWLDPRKYRSTWQANQALHRIRLALADGAELILIAPGVDCFAEKRSIDETIRDYGYCGIQALRELVESGELAGDLAGAAHLAHGSTEGRFRVRYAPGGLGKDEIEEVGYSWADCRTMSARYDPAILRDGWNRVAGEDIYFIRDPTAGLWARPGVLED